MVFSDKLKKDMLYRVCLPSKGGSVRMKINVGDVINECPFTSSSSCSLASLPIDGSLGESFDSKSEPVNP